MNTRLINGNKIAKCIKKEVAIQVEELTSYGIQPGLAVILVGSNPASQIYVRKKIRTCIELGIHSEQVNLPEQLSTQELLTAIGKLNQSENIDGILVQLPLPKQINTHRILNAIHPGKDVDGFNPVNVGKLCSKNPCFVPCTPAGILQILVREKIPLIGQKAVIIGRSDIVGKPLALLLLHQHCTVTICHSRTRNLAEVSSQADILVSAVGKAGIVTSEFIKMGATVIDVGMNRVETKEEFYRLFGKNRKRLEIFQSQGYCLVGDVNPLEAEGVAGLITPVPGGVGPLTIAQLMKNTLLACQRRRGQNDRSLT